VVNDVNRDLTNFYNVLRDPDTFPEFFRRANLTLFSEATWRKARALLDGGESDRQGVLDRTKRWCG
jgi:hypothetical protein